MYPAWPPKPTTESLSNVSQDVADTGLADVSPVAQQALPISFQPQLVKDQSHPPPPPQHQPPKPPSSNSLSLTQLRRIVNEFPKIDTATYAFSNDDSASFAEEIEEWFSYNPLEYKRLELAKETFERRWKKFSSKTWAECESSEHEKFVEYEINRLPVVDLRRRCKSLQTILHIVLGVWHEKKKLESTDGKESAKSKSTPLSEHLQRIKYGVALVAMAGGISIIFDILQSSLVNLGSENLRKHIYIEEDLPFLQNEFDSVTTIFYSVIEGTRNDNVSSKRAHECFTQIGSNIVNFLLRFTASRRWDEVNKFPQTRIFLLVWKSILLILGGTSEINTVKKATCEPQQPETDGGRILTASPLDYHMFHREIISKYPAYIPPQPLLPLEPDNNSILPLFNRSRAFSGSNGLAPALIDANGSGASILHQPVHIATPAPSPPPSPPVGGKAGKRQNYQTNQNFPFMYPPLDSTSNSAGGKGQARLQELLVGRKWDGSDIPKSILEAGDLFSKRMRMTRAIRQLWDEREKFLRFERRWDESDDEDVSENDLESPSEKKFTKPQVDYGPNENVTAAVKEKLDLVECVYEFSLPHLQSLVIVLLKAVLANVTTFLTPSILQHQGLAPGLKDTNARASEPQAQSKTLEGVNDPLKNLGPELSMEEIDALRSREIRMKAVSGILIVLLKWFKVSHVLKFEYLTQLLLDSNYLPLVLKVFAHQDVDKVVTRKKDCAEIGFFSFCNISGEEKPTENEIMRKASEERSDEDAIPPPIKLQRKTSSSDVAEKLPALYFQDTETANGQKDDEIDHSNLDSNHDPITEFSQRNLISYINLLRIMQKICKNKAHRNLLLVQYKSSIILKKALKISQPELRLYTLKLFKNQVPYCGRKWRQGNMRVITAVYLHCRPELRDDWLAGSDVNAEVEDALPLEQALRSLTHWYNIKRYPYQMGTDPKQLTEAQDFFTREIEKMENLDEFIDDGDIMGEVIWE
ncbi:hypothetical protein K3495_g4656 [Podosphaera aphanis]|nr:hypothetical protein K3495_g4656 [Podosphaera aphanis]